MHRTQQKSFEHARTVGNTGGILATMFPDTVSEDGGESSVDSHGLVRASLGYQIATVLRNEILFGRLAAGELLSQDAVCTRFETSRMPVRDAFRQLVHEGFLVRTSAKQVRVASFNEEDIADMFYVEATLHSLLTKRAVERATDGELGSLTEIHSQMLESSAAGDLKALSSLNRRWHQRINHLADSPKLLAGLRAVSLNVLDAFFFEHPELVEKSNIEHGQIVAAMKRRDGASAAQAMFEHVTGCGAASVIDIRKNFVSERRSPEVINETNEVV